MDSEGLIIISKDNGDAMSKEDFYALGYNISSKAPYKIDCDIKFWKEHEDAKTPNVAYNGTSACFDLYSIEDKTIFPGESAKVENGIRVVVPKGYYVRFCTRSGHGFMEDLFVYPGVLDEGWTGNLAVKLYNLSPKKTYYINKGEKYAQVEILKKHPYKLTEVSKEEFDILEENAIRGQKGWGSSGK